MKAEDRWLQLSRLAYSLERCVRAAKTIDGKRSPLTRELDQRMLRLHGTLDRECERLTAELLDAEFARRVRRKMKVAS